MDHLAHFVVNGNELIDAGASLEAAAGNVAGMVKRGWIAGIDAEQAALVVAGLVGHLGVVVENALAAYPEHRRHDGRLQTAFMEGPGDQLDLPALEREVIRRALDRFGGNKSRAAEYLRILEKRHRRARELQPSLAERETTRT